jgi:hypothetical protein
LATLWLRAALGRKASQDAVEGALLWCAIAGTVGREEAATAPDSVGAVAHRVVWLKAAVAEALPSLESGCCGTVVLWRHGTDDAAGGAPGMLPNLSVEHILG